MDLSSQEPIFSSDPATKDFEILAGKRWIYPENLQIREYQFTITKTALFHNTLVCLPTGLGKTFIAAVVMFNYWRWYPRGIIVFLAPTKPLVTQQIDACHDIMGIPISDTIELTGQINPKLRETAWKKKRVIFATPQTFQKDLEKGIVPTKLIKCVVIDEAHKALGKHAYSESIRILNETHKYFRVLGLSATPGSKLEAVQEVIRNLLITRLELRDDISPDIAPYINERKMDIILVDLGNDLVKFKEKYISIMDRHVKILINNNAIRGTTANISKGLIFILKKQFGSQQQKHRNHGIIMKTLTVLLTMYHAYELIIRHGLRAFYNFYMKCQDKFWLKNEIELSELLEEIGKFIGPFPDVASLMDGSVTNIPNNIVFGHGKFLKLQELLLDHFHNAENKENNTRAIVFVEYRDIVNEVFVLLSQSKPLIRPQVFVGQAGLKQKAQTKALDNFRKNVVNVLISTSVGEEGLDVGEVDLIICFDISQGSPTRLVQRMGRTGRKRDGHIIILVTDGKEHQTLKSALSKRDSLNDKVLASSEVLQALHPNSPRMVPENIEPECLKMNITVIPKNLPTKKGKAKKKIKAVEELKILNMDEEKMKKTAGKKNIVVDIGNENTEEINLTEVRGKKTANLKTKNKKIINSEIPRRSGQSTLTKFFTNSSQFSPDEDVNIVNMRMEKIKLDPIRSQFVKNGNTIKPTLVKILALDNPAVEFLTLCTLKNSEKDLTENRNFEIPYMPKCKSYGKEEGEFFDNFEIPSYKILDCIKSLDEYIKPVDNDKIPDEIEDADDNWKFLQPTCPQYSRRSSESPVDLEDSRWKFEDLLDESDSDATFYDASANSPPAECVDWSNGDFEEDFQFDENQVKNKNDNSTESEPVIEGGGFEDLLNHSSDEEIEESTQIRTSLEKNSVKSISKESSKNFMDKFTRVSLGSSSESIPVVGGGFEGILDESTDESRDGHSGNSKINSRIIPKGPITNSEAEVIDLDVIDITDDDDITFLAEHFDSEPKKTSLNAKPMETENIYHQNKFINHSTPMKPVKINSSQRKNNDGISQTKMRNFPEELEMDIDDLFENEIVKKSTPVKFDMKNSSNSKFPPIKSSVNKDSEKRMINSQTDQMNLIDDFGSSFCSWNSINSVGSNSKKITAKKTSQDNFTKTIIETTKVNSSAGIDFSETYEPITSRIKKSLKQQNGIEIPQKSFQSKKSLNDSGEYSCAQTVDVNLIDDFETFSSWETMVRGKSKESNKPNVLVNSLNENKVNSITNQNKLSQGKKKLNSSQVNSDFRNEIAEIDSLFDSDFEENLSPKKNQNSQKKSTENLLLLSENLKEGTMTNSQNNKNGKPALVTHSAGMTNPGMSSANVDDFDWDSDFETDLLTQSKFFRKQEPSITPLSKFAFRPDLVNRSKVKLTDEAIEKTLRNNEEQLVSKKNVENIPENIRLAKIRAAIQPKRQKVLHEFNNDSDDDFMTSKIEKSVFNCRQNNFSSIDKVNSSSSTNSSKNEKKNPPSTSKALSIQDLKKFSAPKKNEFKQPRENERSTRLEFVNRERKKKEKKRKRKLANRFIDDEAEVSFVEDGFLVSSDDGSNDDDDDDEDLGDFVSYTQHHDEEVDMRALYLQSVKSPSQSGRFHIKMPKTPPPDFEIFSQGVPEPDSYVHDSFCVQEDEEILEGTSSDELPIDEEISRKSRKHNKKRKRKRKDSTESSSKRKRIIIISSDSSEDETEKLRAAIEEESKRLNHF